MKFRFGKFGLLCPTLLLWAGLAQAEGGMVITAIPLDSRVTPLTPVAAAPVMPSETSADQAMALLPAAPRAGLPRPSVVLGDLAVLLTMAERGPLGVPFPQRQAIRERDAAMFDRLLIQGAFDPDPANVGAAIQTELARMGCYSGGIDGDWGRGSAAALTRYIDAGGSAQSGAAPDVGLFRDVARGSDVTCPEQRVVAPATVATPRRETGARANSASTAAAGASPSRASQAGGSQSGGGRPASEPATPPAQSGGAINRGLMGAGVFR